MVSRPKNLQFQTLFDDEKQQLFQNDMSFGNNLNDSAWDLDRSTPMGTLKNLIRHINTPRSSTDLTIAKALVLRVEDQIKSLYEIVNRPTAAKFVETLQRSNEQLVKLAALVYKKDQASNQTGLTDDFI